MVWSNALTGCGAYKQSGTSAGNWRLPTQRELMLIWVMQKKGQLTGLSLAGDVYWSSTIYSNATTSAWNILFGDNGITSKISVNYGYSVRCVRDF